MRLGASPTLSSASYRLTGLPDGDYRLHTALSGFELAVDTSSADGYPAVRISSGVGSKDLTLKKFTGRLRADFRLPAGSADYGNISLSLEGPGTSVSTPDVTGLPGTTFQVWPASASWTSRAELGSGLYQLRAQYRTTGAVASREVFVVNGLTSSAAADLRGATQRVSGVVRLAGSVSFHYTTYSVTVGSLRDLAGLAAESRFCSPVYGGCISTSSLRMELYPFETGLGGLPEVAYGSGYAAPIATSGAYGFEKIPPGTYLLADRADLDGDDSNGGELPLLAQTVVVGTTSLTADLSIVSGRQVRGTVRAPLGRSGIEGVVVSLVDAMGVTLQSRAVDFAGGASAEFILEQAAAGGYLLRAADSVSPPRWVAPPVALEVAADDVDLPALQLYAAAAIKGSISVKQVLVLGSSTTFAVTPIGRDNRDRLPPGLRIAASADPWVDGGVGSALLAPDGRLDLDSYGRFQVVGLRPGSYRLVFSQSGAGGDRLGDGSFSLAPLALSGITVEEGQSKDIGVVELRPTQDLSGLVLDAAGAAVPNIPVVAIGGSHSVETRTDASGRFLLSLDPGQRYYDIWAARRDELEGGASREDAPYEARLLAAVDILAQIAELRIVLERADASLACRVAAEDGGTLENPDPKHPGQKGAKVYIQKAAQTPVLNPLGDLVVNTAEDGSFTVAGLVPGEYKLVGHAVGYRQKAVRRTLSSGENTGCVLTLDKGATLSGVIVNPDNSNPSRSDVAEVLAVSADNAEVLVGSLRSPGKSEVVDQYEISGFRPALAYHVIIKDAYGNQFAPPEARGLTFSDSSEKKRINIQLRKAPPEVRFVAEQPSARMFQLYFNLDRPLRSSARAEDNAPAAMVAVSTGVLSAWTIREDRLQVSADLDASATSVSSLAVAFAAYSNVEDPFAAAGEYWMMRTTAAVFLGVDAAAQTAISAATGGEAKAGGKDPSKVTLPAGALDVDASSTVVVTVQQARGGSPNSFKGQGAGAGRSVVPRYGPAAYPEGLYRALAAVPPTVNPLSAFYDFMLPLGLRTQLRKPAELVINYDTATVTDPTALNLYWFNEAANLYVLQNDALGRNPEIDWVNHTIKVRVNHFSTFVLLNSRTAVITDAGSFGGGEISAFNYPNPFDLAARTVTRAEDAGQMSSIRGTMIRIGLPAGVQGEVRVHIFDVAGERVRSMTFTAQSGGKFNYLEWDGRNDAGKDVASGVYIGEAKAGGKKAFFKMGLVK